MKLRVERPQHENKLTNEQRKHASETSLDGYPGMISIINSGDLNSFEELAQTFADYHFEDRIKN